jgi:hypothetical protein
MMHGDESPAPPAAPTIIQAPQPLQQTASEAADAQVEAFGKLIPLLPQYAQTLTDIQKTQAPQMSQINIDQQKQYGPQLIQAAIDNLKLADPTGLAAREALGKRVLGGLGDDQFGKLSDSERRQAEQDIRAGQVARGGGTALSDTLDEAISKYNLGNQRQQQQLSNVGSFLAGTPPQASFGSLNQAGQTAPVGTQNVSGFSSSMFPSTNSLIDNQSRNYNTYAGFASNQNQYNLGVAKYNQDYSSNPFMTGIGVASGVLGNVMGGMAGCWVADEIYGKTAAKTLTLRAYVKKHTNDNSVLGTFCREYLKHGIDWAESIKTNLNLREEAREIWDELYNDALKEAA